MKYKVGDEVVLKETWGKFSILEVDSDISGYLLAEFGWINEVDIDHDKTAELQRENYAKYMEEQINDPAYQDLLKEMSEPILDNVNHPSHYKQGKYEAIDVIKDVTMDYSGYEGYLIGNIIKYLYRANYKGNKLEDLKKGQYYYDELIDWEEDLDE